MGNSSYDMLLFVCVNTQTHIYSYMFKICHKKMVNDSGKEKWKVCGSGVESTLLFFSINSFSIF